MTVTLTPGFKYYDADGVQTVFPIPFNFLGYPPYIKVYDTSEGFDPEFVYVQGTDYLVTGLPANPAVTFFIAPAQVNGGEVFINREVPADQLVMYPISGVFPAAATGTALDKLTILIQQLIDGILNGTIEFATFMRLVMGKWQGTGHEIIHLLPGAEGDSAATVAQVIAIFEGGVPAVISGQFYWTFLGAPLTTDFPLPGSFGHVATDFQVFIEGAHQTSGGAAPSYTVVPGALAGEPDILRFSTAPPSGNQIEVYIPSGTAVLTPGVTVVGPGQIANDAVTINTIAPGPEGNFIKTAAGQAAWAIIHTNDIPNLAAFLGAFPLSSMGAAVAPLNMGGQKIVSVQAGVNPTDAANVSQLLPGKKSKSGTASWASSPVSWTTVLTFNFNVGLLTVMLAGSTGSNDMTFAFGGNTTEVVSPTAGVSASATRISVPGGTQVTVTTSLGTGNGLTGVQNRAYYGAEGDA